MPDAAAALAGSSDWIPSSPGLLRAMDALSVSREERRGKILGFSQAVDCSRDRTGVQGRAGKGEALSGQGGPLRCWRIRQVNDPIKRCGGNPETESKDCESNPYS